MQRERDRVSDRFNQAHIAATRAADHIDSLYKYAAAHDIDKPELNDLISDALILVRRIDRLHHDFMEARFNRHAEEANPS